MAYGLKACSCHPLRWVSIQEILSGMTLYTLFKYFHIRSACRLYNTMVYSFIRAWNLTLHVHIADLHQCSPGFMLVNFATKKITYPFGCIYICPKIFVFDHCYMTPSLPTLYSFTACNLGRTRTPVASIILMKTLVIMFLTYSFNYYFEIDPGWPLCDLGPNNEMHSTQKFWSNLVAVWYFLAYQHLVGTCWPLQDLWTQQCITN